VLDPFATARDLTIFYTGLYHSLLAPTTWTEADNLYLTMGVNGVPAAAPEGTRRYTDLSIWDMHRTQVAPWEVGGRGAGGCV
jgi:putative alpha-1,2-mannosidase